MKLVFAIVQDEDSPRLITALMDEGLGVTKLASTGGFLKSGNTTLLVGLDDDKLDLCLGLIEKTCKNRRQIATSQMPLSGAGTMYAPYPIEVTVGGATIFVLSVDQFVKF